MLRSQKKPILVHPQATHVDLFVEHYDLLKRWALQFAEHDQELAEDLLHDAFIQFTISKPDLSAIQNLDGYLYVVMRNLHLSQMRKAGRTSQRPVTVVDFDSVDMSFWASDPRDRLRMRDELAAVCQFACIRKETAKSGSVLILRFFHGYYPEEIAKVLRSNAYAVTMRLRAARNEVKLFIEDPSKLAFLDSKSLKIQKPDVRHFGDDLRLELRRQIFASRKGDCLDKVGIEQLYTAEGVEGIDQRTAAHIVSCQFCIETVNALLDLPPLASRYPLDTLGNDPGKKGGGSSGGGKSGGGPTMLDSYTRRRDEHFHHQPQELRIAVNGQIHTSLRVVAGKGEMSLNVDSDESLGFVEVFSEIGLRLLMLNVEPPPAGDGKQSMHIELSGGRTLAADLSFSGHLPELQIVYNDPLIAEAKCFEVSTAPDLGRDAIHVPFGDLRADLGFGGQIRIWFEPMRIAIAAAALVVVAFGIWFVNQPASPEPLVARTVLKRARDAEFALAPAADKVLHRNYQLEEWSNGNLKSRNRIDEWRHTNQTARRTYDESGQMVAGAWTKEDGSQQVFEQGERLREIYKRDVKSDTRAEPTVNSFANLIDRHGVTSRVAVTESSEQYIFNFEDRVGETEQKGISDRLIAASLTLDRKTLNPITQAIVLQIGDEQREYRFSDVRLEQKIIGEVSPMIFLPEAELTRGATKITKPLEIDLPQLATGLNTNNAAPITNNTATLDTEVEIFRALDSVNALSGDQITVTRTAAGQLKISGIVDSTQRKTEILNALNQMRNSPGVTVDVLTAAEAASLTKQKITGDNITIERVTAATDTLLPVEPELKAYFAKKGMVGEGLNSEIRNYAGAVINRSRALRRNALAFKSLAERFSPAELDRLDAAKREQWKVLLRSKAAAIAGDVRSLDNQLSTVGLDVGGDGSAGGASVRDVTEVAQAAQRLFGLAAACDAQVQQSFVISGKGTASVKTAQFWRAMKQMAVIAADVQGF